MRCLSSTIVKVVERYFLKPCAIQRLHVDMVLLDADALQINRCEAVEEWARRGALARRFGPEVR